MTILGSDAIRAALADGAIDRHPYDVLAEGGLAAWVVDLDREAAWRASQKIAPARGKRR